jgi:hypothetical protein
VHVCELEFQLEFPPPPKNSIVGSVEPSLHSGFYIYIKPSVF